MATQSPNRGFSVPTPSSDIGLWGTELNATLSDVDNILGGSLVLQSSNGSNITLATSQAQYGRLVIMGALSTEFVITFTAGNNAVGNFLIWNNSSASGGYSVLCQTGSSVGQTCVIPANQMRQVNADGTNVQFSDNLFLPLVAATVNFNISGGGATPPTGWYGNVKIPYTFTTSSYTISCTSDFQGSAQVDIYHAYSTGSYPGGTSEARLTLSSAFINSGSYGPVVYSQNDLMGFLLFSSSSLTSVNVAISGTRSLSS